MLELLPDKSPNRRQIPPEIYRLFFESVSDAIFCVDLNTLTIPHANNRFLSMVGHDSDQLLGGDLSLLVPQTRQGPTDRVFSLDMLNSPGLHEDVRLRRADDQALYASVAVGQVLDPKFPVVVCVLRDATERRLLERELITKHMALRQTHGELLETTARLERRSHELMSVLSKLASISKQAAIGAFTAGVAHGINNPLAVVQSATRELAELVDSPHSEATAARQRLLLQRLADASHRIAKVVTDVRKVHKQGAPRRANTQVDLPAEAESALALCSHRMKEVSIIRRYAPVPKVYGIPDELQYLMSNLFENAMIAMSGKGVLCIEIASIGEQVRVVIEDTGPGLPPEIVERLFEAFATGRPDGTGLGLNIAEQIARQHHGRLTGENRKGASGARFVLTLPMAPSPKSEGVSDVRAADHGK